MTNDDERPWRHQKARCHLAHGEAVLQQKRQRHERQHLRAERAYVGADRQREHGNAHQVDRKQRRALRELSPDEEIADDRRRDELRDEPGPMLAMPMPSTATIAMPKKSAFMTALT